MCDGNRSGLSQEGRASLRQGEVQILFLILDGFRFVNILLFIMPIGDCSGLFR